MSKVQARLLRDVEMLSGRIKAGKVMDVVSLTLYADNLGICGIPVNAVEFIGVEDHEPGERRDPIPPGPDWKGPNSLPPWIGPNKTVAVPEFVPAAKPAEAVKPVAAGQLSMFDEAAAVQESAKEPAKKPSLEELDFDE